VRRRLFKKLEDNSFNMHSNSTVRAIVAVGTALSAQQILHGQTMQYDVSYLNGGYAYSISGSAMDPISGSTTRIAEAGRLAADGAGNVSGADTVIVAGSATRRTFSGTYTINPDATGALVLNPSWGPQIHADFFAGGNGSVLRLVLTDSGNTLSGVLEAQQSAGQVPPSSGYTSAVLNGGYDYGIAGSGVDFYGNVTPIREVGRLTADGAGNLTGSSTVSINGSVVRRMLTGTYSINWDGSGTATLYPTWGPAIDIDLFISANGLTTEFVVTDSGSTLSGTMTAGSLPSSLNTTAR
jgi:hypothetical protein